MNASTHASGAGPHDSLGEQARAAARVGVFGGSFDPPHRGHLHVAERAREAFDLDHVIYIPAARPPHKPERVLAPGDARVEMLECLLADQVASSIWTGELHRPGPSFTLDTLRALARELAPNARVFLILGSDNLAGFPAWRGVEEILVAAQPIVIVRRGFEFDATLLEPFSAEARAALERGFLVVEPFDASSSALRASLARGELPADSFPPALQEYLRASDIYGGP